MGNPQGLTRYHGVKHSSSVDSQSSGSSRSSTTLALDERLEEKERVGFQFEREKRVRKEIGGSEGFGRGTVPRCSWGVLPHLSYLTAFGAGTDRLWFLGKLWLPTSPILT